METVSQRRWQLSGSVNYLHWSVGLKLEIPRATKHNYQRWSIKVRVLCFGAQLTRLNDTRVPKKEPVNA